MEYTIVYSNRRTLSVEVRQNGQILVRAPRFCSKLWIEAFVSSHEAVLLERRNEILSRPPIPVISKREAEAFREKTRALVHVRLEYWKRKTGIPYGSVKVTQARGRFGSCSERGDLCFSLFLSLADAPLADYVVLHELCHVRHHNHGKEFYALLETYMPDRKAREAELKKMVLPRIDGKREN